MLRSSSETDREGDGYKSDNIRVSHHSFLWGSLAAADEQTNIWLLCNNCFSMCNRSVEHTDVISLNTFVLPVINSNLVPIVPHRGSVEQLAATVFALKVKGDVLTKYH